MKHVKFESLHGQDEVDVPDLGEFRVWKNGEIKPLPDEFADLILTNSNFKEVSTEATPTVTIPASASDEVAEEDV